MAEVKRFAVIFLALAISACSPQFNWRDVRGVDAPFTVLMPDKPSQLSNEIQIGDKRVTMAMTAARIDGVTFAVGAAKMASSEEARAALPLIKSALMRNLAGVIAEEKTSETTTDGMLTINNTFVANGVNKATTSSSLRMIGRLVTRDVWVFEVVVVGSEKAINLEAADTFISSFKPT